MCRFVSARSARQSVAACVACAACASLLEKRPTSHHRRRRCRHVAAKFAYATVASRHRTMRGRYLYSLAETMHMYIYVSRSGVCVRSSARFNIIIAYVRYVRRDNDGRQTKPQLLLSGVCGRKRERHVLALVVCVGCQNCRTLRSCWVASCSISLLRTACVGA